MAKTVRKLKRIKAKEQYKAKISSYDDLPPAIIVTPPDIITQLHEPNKKIDVKVRPNNITTMNIHESKRLIKDANNSNNDAVKPEASTSQSNLSLLSPEQTLTNINVSKLIAELSENSKASKEEMEQIQRKLLQQANDILKVNAFANSDILQTNTLDNSSKYSTYGKVPVIIPRNINNGLSKIIASKLIDLTENMSHQGSTVLNKTQNGNRHQSNVENARYDIGQSNQVKIGEQCRISVDNHASDTQLVPERLQRTAEIPRPFPVDNSGTMINSGQGNMQRVAMTATAAGRGVFFSETGSAIARAVNSSRAALLGVSFENGTSVQLSAPPAYRMPPAPEAALPGAPAPTPAALHTHSAKFPIEREVILSSGEKNSKVPILQEARRRGRLAAVAPDTPPKTLAAWTHGENQQAGPSGDANYRQYPSQNYSYTMQNQGAIPRNNYETSPKPPVPAKNSINSQKPDAPNNSQSITVTVETGKDSTRDAPKSSKSVSKTYHTLKDMISSKFKSKDTSEAEKPVETDQSLNNNEERKPKPENESSTPRENGVRKMQEQAIYGRPMPQNRPDMQYNHGLPNNMAYPSPSAHRQQLIQQQIVQQQLLMNQQARSQEMLASSTPQSGRPTALVADSLYQQYGGPPGRRSAMYQRDIDVRSLANFTSLKQTAPQSQMEHHSRADLRSPQQLEREIVRQRGLVESRRASSHPHLLDEPQYKPEIVTPQLHERSRRNSHGNLLDAGGPDGPSKRREYEERESDDGGFRARLVAQGRSSFEDKPRSNGKSSEYHRNSEQRLTENIYRKTPDNTGQKPEVYPKPESSRRTPDSVNHRILNEPSTSAQMLERTDESASQKSVDSMYHSSGKIDTSFNQQPSSSRQTPNRIEDLKSHGRKGASGSGASSDYDKNGGQSSNVDSGRGSVAYSSGRRPEPGLHDTSVDSDPVAPSRSQPQPGPSQQPSGQGENEWVDMVECELRQILEPKLAGMRLDSSGSSVSSVTPPLPPMSPSSDVHKRNSLPARSSEYVEDRRRGRESPRWHSHKKHSSKRDHHYKKHLFGLDTTDITSTTTRSLDLSSLLDGRTDSDASTGDARAIRRQLRGLENMYAEVLQLLGVRKPTSLGKHQPWESSRLSSKRRYGSMSSLPSSSVSSRPVRDKRRSTDHRKKHDFKGINKRFQRLESHVVTLARSVAHLSSEMRTQHLVMQEMDAIRAEISALRHMYKSQAYLRHGHHSHNDPFAFSNPDRVKRLTKFFGDEPPLMRLFLKRLGYEKYAALLEKEKVGAAELPYVGEDRLRALGVPLGPRMRILKEAGIHHDLTRDDPHNTTTTLAIV